jgi:hypothetical protein
MQHLGLPIVVDAPGSYLTRGGDVVTVEIISTSGGYGYQNRADGHYSTGVRETWSCRGGRVLPYSLSQNDIVARTSTP